MYQKITEEEGKEGVLINEFELDFRKKWFDPETGHFHSFSHPMSTSTMPQCYIKGDTLLSTLVNARKVAWNRKFTVLWVFRGKTKNGTGSYCKSDIQ